MMGACNSTGHTGEWHEKREGEGGIEKGLKGPFLFDARRGQRRIIDLGRGGPTYIHQI